ncbi:hypothetical protein [Paracoccus sp. pheM1]|uniref:DUF7065 domain-containing protein n=1 Tax=Paracoccus sp. pheM1 TaxID=2831675 RepID=UPI001BDB9184|nr:hypothetical protein [Paracoccus sp. pheM1]MBT0782953.1 hypothetical protein [Paracoccus sp. pheM1]
MNAPHPPITPQTLDFQAPADADHHWIETMLIPFVLPEEGIYGLIYLYVRPALEVMTNQIIICGALSDSRGDLLHYADNQQLPAISTFRDFTTPLGLSVRFTRGVRDFRVDYVGRDGTEFHFDWTGLMDPFDIHNPAHSPQAGKARDIHADIEPGQAHRAGHFDATGHVSGTLKLRGNTYRIDCIERMDHSWGPRDATVIRPTYIVSATFSRDLFFHMICPWDPAATAGEQLRLSHGYVCEGGEVFGLTDVARIEAQHFGNITVGLQMQVTDTRGKTWDLVASPNVGAPWYGFPSAVTYLSLMRFFMDGQRGYGIVMANHNMGWLNETRGRFLNDPCPRILA